MYTMGYYSAIKRNAVLMHATTWIDLENITPGEITGHMKSHIIYFHLCEMSSTVKFFKKKVDPWLSKAGGKKKMRNYC